MRVETTVGDAAVAKTTRNAGFTVEPD